MRSLTKDGSENFLKPARASQVIAWIKEAALGAVEIELDEDRKTMGSATVIANGINAITISERDLPRVARRTINNSAAHTGIPVAWLVEFRQVIDISRRSQGGKPPALLWVDWQIIARAEKRK